MDQGFLFRANVMLSGEEFILAACDEELIGKEFREGKKRLLVDERFYGGKLVGPEELVSLLGEATIANLTGERVVQTAIDAGIINPSNVLRVDGVPHAQLARRL